MVLLVDISSVRFIKIEDKNRIFYAFDKEKRVGIDGVLVT